jgi:rubredoxin
LRAKAAPKLTSGDRNIMSEEAFRKYECIVCGLIYDEAEGVPDDGIPPGTRWEDVPEDWLCPDCGVGKEDFELI